MNELQQMAFSKALAMLRGAGAKYIVIEENGTEHVYGELKLAAPEPEKKPRMRKQLVKMGTYKNVYAPVLTNLQVGQSATIPYSGLDPRGLQSACTAWCNTKWGAGSTMSHQALDALEIMRVS